MPQIFLSVAAVLGGLLVAASAFASYALREKKLVSDVYDGLRLRTTRRYSVSCRLGCFSFCRLEFEVVKKLKVRSSNAGLKPLLKIPPLAIAELFGLTTLGLGGI